MGQSESTGYVLLCSPYSWSVLLSLLMFWHPPGQTARDCLFILSRKQDFRLPPRQQERPHVQKFIQSFLFQFLFIPSFKGACQFLRLLRILQGRLVLNFLYCWLGIQCFQGCQVILLPSSLQSHVALVAFLFPATPNLVDLCLKKKKCLYCAFGGVAGGSKIGCMCLIYYSLFSAHCLDFFC